MKQLAIFTTPDDADVELRHDAGPVFKGTPSTVQGRPAHLLTIDGVPDGWGARLVVAKDGFVPVEQRGILWLSRPGSFAEFVVDDVQLRPFPVSALPRLVTRGHSFALENGERFTAIECSDFNLLARYHADRRSIEPILEQRAALGFNLLRVWTLMHLSQFGIGDLDPCPYDKVPAFCERCADHGLYVEFTAYTSTFDPNHWRRLAEAAAGASNVILELVNENDQPANTIDTRAFAPIPGRLCAHGSNGSQAAPVQPSWNYQTFHTNDAFEWQRKVGHNAMELGGTVLSNENTRFPDRDSSVIHAFDAAAGAALLCAGSCFHSVNGKRSALFEGVELSAAKAWADGARSVPLEFQDGAYQHRADLERPDDLRAYERRLPDGRVHVVHIRR